MDEQKIVEFTDVFFKNQLNITHNVFDWKPAIIGASISIEDKNNIYNYNEYDLTSFFISIARPNKYIELNNDYEIKILWLHLFNYLFKLKNINIPEDVINDLCFKWTIIDINCKIQTGDNLKIIF